MTPKTLKWIAPCLAVMAGIALWLAATAPDETGSQLLSIALTLGVMVRLVFAMPSLVTRSSISAEA